MEPTNEEIAETLTASAEAIAAKLNLTKRPLEWRSLCDEEVMMLVTPEGINIGRLHANYGEMRTYRYENFWLNGVELLEKRYGITETGWEHMPTVTTKVDEETTSFYWSY